LSPTQYVINHLVSHSSTRIKRWKVQNAGHIGRLKKKLVKYSDSTRTRREED
jgi:hypothetical protein